MEDLLRSTSAPAVHSLSITSPTFRTSVERLVAPLRQVGRPIRRRMRSTDTV
jgi:hypothetical protein